MVKVGGYILGEFGNLIAGDQVKYRKSNLFHSHKQLFLLSEMVLLIFCHTISTSHAIIFVTLDTVKV